MQGVKEAKKYMEDARSTAKAKAASSSSSQTAAKTLAKFFRVASPKAKAMGKARVTMEEAVKRTERILLDKKRLAMAKTVSKEEKAEILAQELHNEPGSLLQEKELAHIYQESGCVEVKMDRNTDCDMIPFAKSIRTITGECNNLENPTQGASFTPFNRILQAQYADGISEPFNQGGRRGKGPFVPPSPSARLVSDTAVRDRQVNDSRLTICLMMWGQFIDHDNVLAGEPDPAEVPCGDCEQSANCLAVRIPNDDEDFGVGTRQNGVCLPFRRSLAACPENPSAFNPREQINELTHYIDGSMIYGSTNARAAFARTNTGDGKLRVSAGNNLPIMNSSQSPACAPDGPCCPPQFGDNGCFFAGDVRVLEHVSLTALQAIFVREHNRVVDALAQVNPQWDGERLYLEARNIVIAEVQQITYYEYLPALYGTRRNMERFIPPYKGYNPRVDASIPNSFASAAYRFGHSQVQPFFERLGNDFTSISAGPLSLRDSFFTTTGYFGSADNGIGTEADTLLRGWLTTPAREVDEFVNFVLTTQLFETDNQTGMDLVTLNIQRGRDHGLPRYGTWRRFCMNAFNVRRPFRNDLTKIRLRQLYGMEQNIDLFVGALAEEPLARGGGALGAVTSCIFGLTFSRLRDGDRFWYENRDPNLELFTEAQLQQIRRTSLARILCDNTNLEDIQRNPFLQGNRGEICNPQFSNIAGIDFSAWREEDVCAYRATFRLDDMRSFDLTNRPQGTGRNNVTNFNFVSNTTSTQCIPIRCPTASLATDIIASPRFTSRSGCRLVGTTKLVFAQRVQQSDIQSNAALFATETQCKQSSTTNVLYTYDCRSQTSSEKKAKATTTDLEKELAKILQRKDDTLMKYPYGLLVPFKVTDDLPRDLLDAYDRDPPVSGSLMIYNTSLTAFLFRGENRPLQL